ncbi:Extracellular solute-binding protein, family 3 precursor [Marinobacter nitratireducens]|uniref:Extracellular solute-binding protein, family 3 n=1 Tax=Marinobacter nitratireducens TaxID=1137280 RepID=A0A072NJ49_9GAMM|nr:transporter substrate-binding domain-containing protein [Marinobacter nitratireducens]KEF33155.1 Extracellular solute-binding protein, family 3 precursor [Marinobacter nitratireducens]
MLQTQTSHLPSRFILKAACLFILLTANLAFATQDECKSLIVSGNPEYPPLLWPDPDNPEELIGVVPALLHEILTPMGVTPHIQNVGSWARVQHLARTGTIDMVAGAFMTKERFGYMDYILPPIIHLPTAIWVPRGKEFLYRHWPDLIGKTGSTLIGNSFGQRFDAYAEENLNIEHVRSIDQSFAMAAAERIDYVLYEQLQGQVKLAREGKADQFVPLEKPISREGLFFTFPKKSPCNHAAFRERVADRLYKLVNNGRVEELVTEYTERYTNND